MKKWIKIVIIVVVSAAVLLTGMFWIIKMLLR